MIEINLHDNKITKIIKLIELGKDDFFIKYELGFDSMEEYIDFFNTHREEILKNILPIKHNRQ